MPLPDWYDQKENRSEHLPPLDRKEKDSTHGSGTWHVFQSPHATALATAHHKEIFTKQESIAMTPDQQAAAIRVAF